MLMMVNSKRGFERDDAGLGFLDEQVVEAAKEALLAGDDDEGNLLDGPGVGEQDINVVVVLVGMCILVN